MTHYQATQLHLAGLDVLLVAALLIYALIFRRNSVPPALILAVLVGIMGASFFVVSALAADEDLPRVYQVAIKLLRDLPVVVIVSYICLLQAKRYSLVSNKPRLRRWFRRGPYVVVALYIASGLVEFVVRPPFLESDANLPFMILVSDALILLPLAGYSGVSAIVFLFTAFKDGTRAALRIQNLCGAAALAGLAILSVHTLVWRAIRVWVPSDRIGPYIEQLSTNQTYLVGFVALSIVLGLGIQCGKGTHDGLADRLLHFLGLAGGLGARLANGQTGEVPVAVPYESMLRAGEADLLDLSPTRRRQADMLFRAYAARQRQPSTSNSAECSAASYLSALDRFYESEDKDTSGSFHGSLVVAASSGSLTPEALNSSENLHEVVKAIREISREGDGYSPKSLEPWIQLAYLALTDAELLTAPDKAGDSLFQPPVTVSSEVFDGYYLAKYQIERFGPDSKGL